MGAVAAQAGKVDLGTFAGSVNPYSGQASCVWAEGNVLGADLDIGIVAFCTNNGGLRQGADTQQAGGQKRQINRFHVNHLMFDV